jgi:hypothetical protein
MAVVPEPAHLAIIDRATWQEAQTINAEHATSRDLTGKTSPASVRFYPYRGRVRCRACRHRAAGLTELVYYQCPTTQGIPGTPPPFLIIRTP